MRCEHAIFSLSFSPGYCRKNVVEIELNQNPFRTRGITRDQRQLNTKTRDPRRPHFAVKTGANAISQSRYWMVNEISPRKGSSLKVAGKGIAGQGWSATRLLTPFLFFFFLFNSRRLSGLRLHPSSQDSHSLFALSEWDTGC